MAGIVPDPATVAGHFPGRPIVPGVALLAAVWRQLVVDGAATGALTSIRGVRFLRPVEPGRSLDLNASRAGDGARFLLADGAEVVARGWLGGGIVPAAVWHGEGGQVDPGRRADELLPHQPPMRLVEAVLEWSEAGARCRGRIAGGCPLGDGAVAPGWALVEVAAQTAAAHAGLRAVGHAPRRPGAIVGLPSVTLQCATVPCERALIAEVEILRAMPPTVVYRAVVSGGGANLMTGELTVIPILPDGRQDGARRS